MKQLTFILLTPALLLLGVLTAASQAPINQGQPSSTAEYRVVYESSWSAATHPIDYPTNSAHYSRLVGATHNASVRFWQIGELASDGIELMAELGSNGVLRDEVDIAIGAETADQYINGPSLSSGPGTITINSILVDSNYPLLTLVSMIAPSPDWFVGIDSVSLLDENGRWRDTITLTMYPYDAGTDDGITYTSPNADANPPQPIRNYSGVSPFSTEPMGILTITRIDTPTPTSTPTMTTTPTVTATPTTTSTPCPQATPEGFMVDFTSPTHLSSQEIGVRIGNGDAITVTAPTGIYTKTGDFSFSNPELITIDLLPNANNAINVAAHVKAQTAPGGCSYGNYTLSRNINIVQDNALFIETLFLPISQK